MFGDSKRNLGKFAEATSVVGVGSVVKGQINCSRNLFVGGIVEGDIFSDSDSLVEVGATGEVRGEIKGDRIIIHGTVLGNIFASVQLEIGSSAKVIGKLNYSLLKLEPGAVFEGQLEHNQNESTSLEKPHDDKR